MTPDELKARILALPPVDPEHHLTSSLTITQGRCSCGAEVDYDKIDQHAAERALAKVAPMSDLVKFLTAALDEDERVAQAVAAEMVRVADQYVPGGEPDPTDAGMYESEDGRNTPAVVVGPARVLADVAAKRAIVEQASEHVRDEPIMTRNRVHPVLTPWAYVLRTIAQPYAARPGFDPAWRV